MPLEVFTFITSLVRTNPAGTDGLNQGDDHIRGFKKAVQDSFPAVDAPCPFTPGEINSWEARILALEATKLVGAIQAFAAVPDAEGVTWLLCDGQAVLRTTFDALFAKLSVTYGNGNGTTTFNLPDYRGEFLRGRDDSAGNDPDAATRTDRGDGTTGDAVGTKQADDLASHIHSIQSRSNNSGGNDFVEDADSSEVARSMNTGAFGGTETRPRNINVLYYIHV